MATCNYTRTTNFTIKDSLPTSDPEKTVLGEELQVEFDAIADALCDKADANNTTTTGDVTNSGTVTNTGAVTNNGTVTNNGAVTNEDDVTNNGTVTNNSTTNLDGDIFVDGDTLETYITEVANTGSGPGTDGKHRYWRIGFGASEAQVNSSFRISDGTIWTGGQGFKNGRRWNKGSLIDLSGVTWDRFFSGGMNSTPSATAWEEFFTGIDAEVIIGTGAAPPSTSARGGAELDFGEGNAVHISGIDINGASSGAQDTVDTVEFSYSDNGSDWTVASTVTGIRASTGADVDSTIDLPHMGNIGDTDPNTLFDESKATIPFLDTSGGGGGGTAYWTFVEGPQDADFTAVAGNYYFLGDGASGNYTATLPSSPSFGDRVGFNYPNPGALSDTVFIRDAAANLVSGAGNVGGAGVHFVEVIYDGTNWVRMNYWEEIIPE